MSTAIAAAPPGARCSLRLRERALFFRSQQESQKKVAPGPATPAELLDEHRGLSEQRNRFSSGEAVGRLARTPGMAEEPVGSLERPIRSVWRRARGENRSPACRARRSRAETWEVPPRKVACWMKALGGAWTRTKRAAPELAL